MDMETAFDTKPKKTKEEVEITTEKVNEEEEQDSEEEDEEEVMFDLKNAIKTAKLLSENLYDPIQDDKLQDWVNKNLSKRKRSCVNLHIRWGCYRKLR